MLTGKFPLSHSRDDHWHSRLAKSSDFVRRLLFSHIFPICLILIPKLVWHICPDLSHIFKRSVILQSNVLWFSAPVYRYSCFLVWLFSSILSPKYNYVIFIINDEFLIFFIVTTDILWIINNLPLLRRIFLQFIFVFREQNSSPPPPCNV